MVRRILDGRKEGKVFTSDPSNSVRRWSIKVAGAVDHVGSGSYRTVRVVAGWVGDAKELDEE